MKTQAISVRSPLRALVWLLAGTTVCTTVFVAGPAGAQPPQKKPQTVKIVLYPAGDPSPALKYQLLPPMIERRPGNAAVLYGKVTAEQPIFANRDFLDKIRSRLQVPLDRFPTEEVRKYYLPMHFLRMAARCESCDWDIPIREEPFFSILVPDAQQARTFGGMLALQSRVHIASHEYDKAIETLQSGYALGRHVAQQPFLVSSLVGTTIHSLMNPRVLEWIQQPDAPNLYWALSSLPSPMIDFRRAAEAEMSSIYLSFPELRDLDKKDYPPAYWNYLLEKVFGILAPFIESPKVGSGRNLLATVLVLEGYPRAKQSLVQWGRKTEDVEKMSAAQVVLLYTMRTYDEIRDDVLKWALLPAAEGARDLQRTQSLLSNRKVRNREILPLASTFLPGMDAARYAELRLHRDFALLRVFSALRLYAFKHGGLPASLKDITEVPVPEDPIRREPFVYQGYDGRSAVLEILGSSVFGASITPEGHSQFGARYEIELKKAP